MIYFDNAATTYKKPPSVYSTVDEALRKYGGNPGRSSHALSLLTAEKIYEVREKTARLFHLDKPENVVFTTNATYALNMAIKGYIQSFCHVLISDIEHNAVYRPIHNLQSEGFIQYDIFTVGEDIEKSIESKIKPETRFIVANLSSNVSGLQVPIQVLSKIREKYGLKIIVDASQIAGHEEINLAEYPIDVICAPAHKALFGIQGCGFSIFNQLDDIKPFVEGGSGTDSKNPFMPSSLPERLEGGTLPTPAILSLGAGIDFIKSVGIDSIKRKLTFLCKYFKDNLEEISGIQIINPIGNGIVSFLYPPLCNEEVAEYLNENHICVRAGFHCAPLPHQKLNTYETGTIRVSFSYFNTTEEIDCFVRVLKKIKSK